MKVIGTEGCGALCRVASVTLSTTRHGQVEVGCYEHYDTHAWIEAKDEDGERIRPVPQRWVNALCRVHPQVRRRLLRDD